MAVNALIWNPLNVKNDRLLVYYNSTKGNLGLRQWSAGEDGWGTFWAEKEESAKGNVKVGTGLTALRWRDWIRVYGIVAVKEGEGKEVNYISLLSPVIQSLSIKTPYPRLTGTGNGKDKAWLYFLTGTGDPVITEKAADNSGTKPINKAQKLLKQTSPPALTNLASAYTHKNNKRYVFFQTDLKSIHAVDVAGNTDVEVSADARAGTPLAATSFIHGEKEVVVVYYVRQADNLLARTHLISGTTKWIPTTLEGAGSPTQENLSVAPNTTFLQNTLVFSVDSEEDVEPQIYTDDWDAIINSA
ncbi:hypothetical protein EDB81DRAFT_954029 [Dactylonectria macrodidyma]|uniref:Fucose-specific lectin n=1 Tax=Dactylonectria macrodidyma TaxID=307937 RepID=A0A9P9D180_9HYPO|nr:hypothetical protein EDB81DRAFT_954029 [Dactylonectria macrodidyma]